MIMKCSPFNSCLAALFLFNYLHSSLAADGNPSTAPATAGHIPSQSKGNNFVDSPFQGVRSDQAFNLPNHKQDEDGDEGGQRDQQMMVGSSPPNCISKCAKCTPCKTVRVPIQPGRQKVGLMEYYPEAWRCKCNNKLYMP